MHIERKVKEACKTKSCHAMCQAFPTQQVGLRIKITRIFGFTGIVFNGIRCLTEYFERPKLIFCNKNIGVNEFPGLTDKMAGPEPSGKSENLCIQNSVRS